MKKAVIFDLDGTLSNTIETLAYYGNRALEKYGLKTPPVEQYKVMVGNGADTLVHRMMDYVGCSDSGVFAKVLEEYNRTYDENYMYLTEVYPGVPELLAKLKEQGVKTAVLTNKPQGTAIQVLNALFGENAFDAALGAREGVPLKPAPDGVFEILSTLGLAKDDCLYVGDTGTDMQTGKAAGLFTVGCLWGFRDKEELEQNQADALVAHPLDILALL